MKKLPIYQITIDETTDQGVNMISLVDEPAIQVDFIKLAKEEVSQMYFSAKKDRQMLYGPFLIPDQLIYRYNDKLGEYYVKFSRESIQLIADKFNEELNNRNINFQHSERMVDGYVAQNWVIDGEHDQSQNYGFKLPEGTWFGGVKVKDEKFWKEEVKTEIVKGFSVEVKAELSLVMSKNKENKMEDNQEVITATVVETNLAPEVPAVPAEPAATPEAPADTNAPTRDEVMQMIDVKFQSLNDEILAIRAEVEKLMPAEGDAAPEEPAFAKQIEDLTAKLTAVEEKLANTAGAPSVKKNHDVVLDDKFTADIERLRKFAKIKI